MNTHGLQPGVFVRVSGPLSKLGTGKVASCVGDSATVEYFHTIARRCAKTVPVPQVTRIYTVASQTRCYVPTENGRWRMGRIGRQVDGEYEVLFPRGEACF